MSNSEEFNDSKTMVVQMSAYVMPSVEEVPNKDWVKYGEDNDFFDYLLGRYYGSTTNHAVINGIIDMVAGNGITSPVAARHPEDYAKAKVWFNTENLKRWTFDLKCLGYYVMILTPTKGGKLLSVEHSPVQNWRAEVVDDEGVINNWYYSDDWTKAEDPKFEPEPYPVFDPENFKQTSVLVVRPYRSGTYYYPYVDYMGALQYAHMEEEISNFHLSNIMNGLAPSMFINFNNGDPGAEERRKIKADVKKALQGSSNAGRWVLSFNDDKERAVTVETIQATDLDKQYEFLSREAQQKILTGHRITSPLLFGIRESGGGLGSNADEIRQAYSFMSRTVLRPYQEILTGSFEEVLRSQGINIPLSIQKLEPIEADAETKQNFSRGENHLQSFMNQGEIMDADVWELVDERPVDYDLEDIFDALLKSTEFAKVIPGDPMRSSEQDTSLFKVRYVYAPKSTDARGESREFCRKMVNADNVYRKEDIIRAGEKPVNPGWGPRGADTYDLWKYKGGGNCHHFWQRQTYLLKNNERISVNEARRMISELDPDDRGEARLPDNDPEVAKRPVDMPNNGFLPKKKKS